MPTRASSGARKEEFLGKRATEAWPNLFDQIQTWIDPYVRAVIKKETVSYERHWPYTGKWNNVTIYSPENGYFVAIYEDITERKEAEQALKESEQRFRSVLDSSLDAIYRFNLQTGRYEYVSPAFEPVVGYSSDEMSSMSMEQTMALIHPDDMPGVNEALVRLSQEGAVGPTTAFGTRVACTVGSPTTFHIQGRIGTASVAGTVS